MNSSCDTNLDIACKSADILLEEYATMLLSNHNLSLSEKQKSEIRELLSNDHSVCFQENKIQCLQEDDGATSLVCQKCKVDISVGAYRNLFGGDLQYSYILVDGNVEDTVLTYR